MKENKKKKIIVSIIGVLVLLVVVGGATLAFFSATDTEEERQITTAKEELDVKINGSTHVSNIKPISNFIVNGACGGFFGNYDSCPTYEETNRANANIATIPITVTNNSSIDINYNLYVSLEGLKLNSTLTGGTSEDIKWILYKLPNENGYSTTPETFGDFYDPEREQKMMYEVQINPEDTHYYLLYIYIEENGGEQNKLQNISFDVKVRGDTKPLDIVGRKLTDVILENNVIKDREPNYKLIPTSDGISGNVTNLDNGLFKVQNIDKNIYYFRGVLPDGNNGNNLRNSANGNYVFFSTIKENDNIFNVATKGSPILWKIIRINEDGSIVLLYADDLMGAGNNTFKWETDSGKPDYVESNIKEILNEWFNNTFSEKEQSMIKETTYCNDRSDNYTAVSKRLNRENPEPTLECKDEKDRITSKIGLLTADEVVMAGGYTQDYLQSNNLIFKNNIYGYNFLEDDGESFRDFITMSPNSDNSGYVFEKSKLFSYPINSVATHVYPVITLNSDVKVSKGITIYNNFFPSGLGFINPDEIGRPYIIDVEE